MSFLDWAALAILVVAVVVVLLGALAGWQRSRTPSNRQVYRRLAAHFRPVSLHELEVSERLFPARMRAEVQRELDELSAGAGIEASFLGLTKTYEMFDIQMSECLAETSNDPVFCAPVQMESFDVGGGQSLQCRKCGLRLLREGGVPYAICCSKDSPMRGAPGLRVEIAAPRTREAQAVVQRTFDALERAVQAAPSYRGKVLSLEQEENLYSGRSSGICVHDLHPVQRGEVVLPERTLRLLDRNVIEFVQRRPDLARFGLSTKKGLLFYGPPGTGKTHTIHYLYQALAGHTVLLICAEDVARLGQYLTLARLLQPSVVVIEDADLIGRERSSMGSACEESLLNKLLNEMDGLTERAEIIFILTTNRPQLLEAALAGRPGRIDQAIEFPLPDAEGRGKLARLYAGRAQLAEPVLRHIVACTDGSSAALIKELMRRSLQFVLERDGQADFTIGDVQSAIEELLHTGGSLNAKLLGATGARTGIGFVSP